MINTIILKQETADAITLGYINESVKRAGGYAADISENLINYLVEEDRLPKKKNEAIGIIQSSFHLPYFMIFSPEKDLHIHVLLADLLLDV